ncbi:MAG: hypothetical protein HZB50_04140 [Chloroflexi bacterium]|nr:hypothetical protein [Chloroflexota bacterium]
MRRYRLAGQEFIFPYAFPELASFEMTGIKSGADSQSAPFDSDSGSAGEYSKLISRTDGWVAGDQRLVEVYDTSRGFLMKVADCGDFIISLHGETINKNSWQNKLSQLDREVILGPALVFALALRGVWSLHASALMYKDKVFAFLGESGQGKSTLAAYLSQNPDWRLVADDILPVIMDVNGLNILPHFPQLKLSVNAQPGVGLPERLPLRYICVLAQANADQMPELHELSTAQTVQALLGHIAGTRMFTPSLLARHLEFSTRSARKISAYKLIHPHRRDTLPRVKEFLEKL